MLRTAAEVAARIGALSPRGARLCVALSGPPGAGKSTLGAALVAALPGAVLVGMDGFHLDNRVLEARGLLARKGAPETFDGAGFVAAMRRIAAGQEVVMPVFDRARDIAIAGVAVIPAEGPVIVEGNYLAFAEPPWDALAELWDLSIRIEEPEEELRRRLVARWLGAGLSREAAEARAEGNDMANGRRIRERALPVDVVYRP